MNEKTLAALRGSIAKWEAIVDGTGTDEGPDNCPLCHLFNKDVRGESYGDSDQEPGACTGCPVAEKTGHDLCAGSPYDGCTYDAKPEDFKRSAVLELAFLKSLIPTESTSSQRNDLSGSR